MYIIFINDLHEFERFINGAKITSVNRILFTVKNRVRKVFRKTVDIKALIRNNCKIIVKLIHSLLRSKSKSTHFLEFERYLV